MNVIAGLTTTLCGVIVAFLIDRPMSSGERAAYLLTYIGAGVAMAVLVPAGLSDGRSLAIGLTSYLARLIGSQLAPLVEWLRVSHHARKQGI